MARKFLNAWYLVMVLRMLSTHYEWAEKRTPFSGAQARARVGSLVNGQILPVKVSA